MMDKKLIRKLNDFYIDMAVGIYIDDRINRENYSIVKSDIIREFECNFALTLDVNSEKEFIETWENIKRDMKALGREPTFAIIPTNEYLYSNLDNLNKKFEIVSREVWQIYDDFENVDNIETNCKMDIHLEKVTDYKKFAIELLESFKGDEKDPYEKLDPGYIEAMDNYNSNNSGFEKEFYFVKSGEQIVGVTASISNDTFYDIHGLAIKKDYRAKGIGKEVLKKQLQICKTNNKIAFLQTEDGFYPAELYRKIGFKDICVEYYYQEKKLNNLKG